MRKNPPRIIEVIRKENKTSIINRCFLNTDNHFFTQYFSLHVLYFSVKSYNDCCNKQLFNLSKYLSFTHVVNDFTSETIIIEKTLSLFHV